MTPLGVSLLSLPTNELVSHIYEPATRILDDRDERYVNQEKDMLDQRMLLQQTPSEAYVSYVSTKARTAMSQLG